MKIIFSEIYNEAKELDEFNAVFREATESGAEKPETDEAQTEEKPAEEDTGDKPKEEPKEEPKAETAEGPAPVETPQPENAPTPPANNSQNNANQPAQTPAQAPAQQPNGNQPEGKFDGFMKKAKSVLNNPTVSQAVNQVVRNGINKAMGVPMTGSMGYGMSNMGYGTSMGGFGTGMRY